MGRSVRKLRFRILSLGLGTVWLLAFVVSAMAAAESADVRPVSNGEGWYWTSRPTTDVPGDDDPVGDAFNYPIPGQQGTPGGRAFQPEHLYVGWDGVNMRPEMFSGIAFDLFSIPEGSDITSFKLTLIWHPGGSNHSTTPNYEAMRTQGLMACAWPAFTVGAPAVAASSADPRDCSRTAEGTVTMPTEPIGPTTLISWTFDLTGLASNWRSGENPAISIEPKRLTSPSQSWQTSFHASTYTETPPGGDPVAMPGVRASVTYVPDTSSEGGSIGEESFTTEIGGDLTSFGDSGGLTDQLASPVEEPSEPERPVLAAGVIEGRPAKFWDLSPVAWLAALVGFLILSASGWLVQSDPAAERPPGAASALMRESKTGG